MTKEVGAFTYEFYDRLIDAAPAWDELERENKYWSADYLNVLAEHKPSGLLSHFCLVKKNGKPVAKLLFQFLDFKLKDSFGDPTGEQIKRSFLLEWLKNLIVPYLNFKMIVSGNLLLSGSYGFKFRKDLSYKEKQEIYQRSIELYKSFLSQKNIKATGILLKDLDNPDGNLDQYLIDFKYSNFKVQPKMKFEIPKSWNSFDDYLAALKSKYRVRYRKARKCLGTIEKRLLSTEEIEKYSEDIYRLYMATVNNAGFNLFLLDETYFYELDKMMPNKFRVNALFDGDEMVAFYTLMDNGNELDAHYLGYNSDKNLKHKLYLNILYFMVEESVNLKKDVLHMSRTALEIKSSVGTVPEEVKLYAKHYNNFLNSIIKRILSVVVPKIEWERRNPFKE